MSGGKFRIVNYYKSLEPAGWNDNAVIRIYNECVNMMNESKATDENQIAKSNWKKEPEMDPDKMQEIWMPMTKEKVKPKKAKKSQLSIKVYFCLVKFQTNIYRIVKFCLKLIFKKY